MSKPWQPYALHILDAIGEISGFRNILVHNYLGDIDAITVIAVIDRHLQPLETCIKSMLNQEVSES